MDGISVKFVQFTLNEQSWVGVIIDVAPLGVSLMACINLATGKSYQMALPGF